jgi:hypothetical protein
MRGGEELPFVLLLRDHAEVRRGGRPDILQWFKESIKGYQLNETTSAYLIEKIEERHGIFILDGFDELRAHRNWAIRVAEAVDRCFSGRSRSRVIVTSRTKEDLLGRFQDYQVFRLTPVQEGELRRFLSLVNADASATRAAIALLRKAEGFEFEPLLILIAMAYVRRLRGRGVKAEASKVKSLFGLLNETVEHLASEPERFQKPGTQSEGELLSGEELRNVRIQVLDRMVREWDLSRKVCRVPEWKLRQYVVDAMSGARMRAQARDLFNYIVPTGVLLERVRDEGEVRYGFLHNMIQYFFMRGRCVRR